MKKTIAFLICSLLFIESSLLAKAPNNKTICLNMIVKNESHVITRCLESVLPIIDTWVIVDTGSTDGTQEIIKNYLKDVPGELYERPWVDFGYNRDEALQLAKSTADYILFMDADDALYFSPDFEMPDLTADSYMTASRTNGSTMEYYFTRMIKASLDWHWYGVVHEYVAAPDAWDNFILEGVIYAYLSGGARSQDPETYHNDIKVLKKALEKDPDNSRYQFYLAQSYVCIGDRESAIEAYSKRVEMGGWEGGGEEVFWSKLQIGRLQDALGMDSSIVYSSLFDAYSFRPSRIEPLYYLAAKARWDGDHQTAYDVTSIALDAPFPYNDRLFVEKWIYDYGMLFEYSIACYWTGKYRESLECCDRMLAMENLPDSFRKYVVDNRKFAAQKLLAQDLAEKFNKKAPAK
jgi:glycosyltransferase involved in cell wall biosynthesis